VRKRHRPQGGNAYSVGICYVGGLDENCNPKNTMTPAQESALVKLICQLKNKYPTITELHGHNEFANKACPCFDVQRWQREKMLAPAGR